MCLLISTIYSGYIVGLGYISNGGLPSLSLYLSLSLFFL